MRAANLSVSCVWLLCACNSQVERADERFAALEARLAALEAQVAALQAELSAMSTDPQPAPAVAWDDITAKPDWIQTGLVPWGQIDGRPAGLDDGDDTASTVAWSNISDVPTDILSFAGSNTFYRNGTDFYFEAVNVNVRSGQGNTWGSTGTADASDTPNGLGNLIVGYNELPFSIPETAHTGSHNLVVGPHHRYTSFGGLVAGRQNTSSNIWASVSGGYANTAAGASTSICGGIDNLASGTFSSVSGGSSNVASGLFSSVSGGISNIASGGYSSVSGGGSNQASATVSSVSGGGSNVASGPYSSVSGGYQTQLVAAEAYDWAAATTSLADGP